MLLGGVIPIATYAVPMLCGLILLPVLLEFDAPAAWASAYCCFRAWISAEFSMLVYAMFYASITNTLFSVASAER